MKLNIYKRIMLLAVIGASIMSTASSAVCTNNEIKADSKLSLIDKSALLNEIGISSSKMQINHFTGSVLRDKLKNTNQAMFTFDDGPSPHSTPQILETLKRHNIKAVFFVLGCQAEKYPELVKQIHNEGHIVGNHTYNHVRLSSLTEDKVRNEIRRTNKLVKSFTGEQPFLMRPPYGDGAANKKLQKIASEEGVTFFLWTIDPTDWKSRNAAKIISSTEKQLGLQEKHKKGGVILMHDIYPTTADSLETIIKDMERNKYCFISPRNVDFNGNSIQFAQAQKEYKSFDPSLSGNKLLVALLSDNSKTSRTVDIIRAHKQGNLMIYLALHN